VIATIAPFAELLEKFREGLLVHEKMVIRKLIEQVALF